LKEQRRLEDRWGRLAGVAKVLHKDKASTTAWARGAEGERRVAAFLDRIVGEAGTTFHDRKVPGTRGNIDHLVVARSGIWIIDAKHYSGRVEQRDVGGLLRKDLRLFVGGRDRTALAEGMEWQVLAVTRVIATADVPVRAALCFVDCEWGLLAKPFVQCDVLIAPPKKLADFIVAPGKLTPVAVQELGSVLRSEFPSK